MARTKDDALDDGGDEPLEGAESASTDPKRTDPRRKRAVKKAAEPMADEPLSEPTFIRTAGPVRVYALRHEQPWRRPSDAIAVPVGPVRGGRQQSVGRFGIALQKSAPAAAELLGAAFEDTRSAPVSPGAPRIVGEPVDLGGGRSQQIVFASAHDPKTHEASPAHAATAARAVVELAYARGWREVLLPLLGTGANRLSPEDVVTAVLDAFMSLTLPDGRYVDVIVLTDSPDVWEALLAACESRALPLSNDLAGGQDALGVKVEVQAIADTLLLRDVEPPLVAGVFGGWGGGKSFAMRLMKERMDEIRRKKVPVPSEELPVERARAVYPWVGHVYTVDFDAWTYAKGDLWASLMHKVFTCLDDQLTIEKWLRDANLPPELEHGLFPTLRRMDEGVRQAYLESELSKESVKERLRGGPPTEEQLWHGLEKQREKELRELETAEHDLAQKRAELEARRNDLRARAETEVERAAVGHLAQKLVTAAGKHLGGTMVRVREEAEAAVDRGTERESEVPPSPSLKDAWAMAKAEPWLFLFAGAVTLFGVLVTSAVPWLEEHFAAGAGGSVALGGVVAAWEAFQRAQSWMRDRYHELLDNARTERERRSEQIRLRLDQLERVERVLTEEEGAIGTIEREIADLETRVEHHKKRAGLARYRSLTELIDERLAGGEYEGRLGILHRCQADLLELTAGLDVDAPGPGRKHKRALFPRGTARIVLFIDDLDRCPPKRVVEVLEAIQLLVKTRLFVVVIAMDERFVTRALEKEYEGILSRALSPSGLDYIEKIIQIPYCVRPIAPEAMRRYLNDQMHISDTPEPPREERGASGESSGRGAARTGSAGTGGGRASAPSQASLPPDLPLRVLDFDLEQRNLLEDCCERLVLSPRSVKRLVNVYKLLKIIWFKSAVHRPDDTDVERGVLALIALAGAHPVPARQLLRELNRAVSRGATEPIAQLITQLRPPALVAGHVDPEHGAMLAAAGELFPKNLAPKDIRRPTFDLALSFCFVGDLSEIQEPPHRIAIVGGPPVGGNGAGRAARAGG